MEIKFITNEVLVKNNKSLKNRGQFGVEMEVERALFAQVIGLEAYPENMHFEVTIKPFEP